MQEGKQKLNLLKLKKDFIRKEFERMNDMQFKAVVNVNGPLLVLAGAGSGKTTVLVNRIAYLLKYGNCYLNETEPYLDETDIAEITDYLDGKTDTAPSIPSLRLNAPKPWNVLAITFTNKAANELKERLALKISDGGDLINAGTFHSICGKILRVDGNRLGYDSNYTIYDTNDSTRVIKDCQKRLNIDDKILSHKTLRNEISRAKDSLISPEEFKETVGYDFRQKQIAEVYALYQKFLHDNNAMDFDDMIVNTVKLFEENPDVLEKYQERYKYIVVDEYQDTNHAQYVLVKMLSDRYKNICVVGDDDQSIYKFRGATIENILSFEEQYNATTIRLEQNYRSTNNILNAANSVIANNKGRKGKNLWSDNGEGVKIVAHTSNSENDEAKFIADTILNNVRDGMKFSDHAILYRMNAQSSTIENVFSRSGILYTVYGGLKFYDRKEIKDVLSYLQFIANPNDDLRLKRIINEPKRGIGDTTVNNASEIAQLNGVSLYEVFKNAHKYKKISPAAANKLKEFCEKMDEIIAKANTALPSDILNEVLEKSGYLQALKAQGIEEQDRVENVNELSSAILHYEDENENPTLNEYLQEVALITDIDNFDENADRVVLMTLHSAKGLEFSCCFLVGMEEGIFPSSRVMFASDDELEEERRLCYVGITRAKQKLYITNARRRMMFGSFSSNNPSRFINEIDKSCIEFEQEASPFASTASLGSNRTQSFNSYTKTSGFGRSNKMQFQATQSNNKKTPSATFSVGDRVSHKVFGNGMVIKATKMGNDTMLEISFETVGTKKIMANFAKIEKSKNIL